MTTRSNRTVGRWISFLSDNQRSHHTDCNQAVHFIESSCRSSRRPDVSAIDVADGPEGRGSVTCQGVRTDGGEVARPDRERRSGSHACEASPTAQYSIASAVVRERAVDESASERTDSPPDSLPHQSIRDHHQIEPSPTRGFVRIHNTGRHNAHGYRLAASSLPADLSRGLALPPHRRPKAQRSTGGSDGEVTA